MASSISSLPRPGTTSSTRPKSTFLEGKKPLRKPEFIIKHGQKHHAFEPEKAPYPLSYERQILELEPLDNRLLTYLRNGSTSFITFSPEELPEQILDLGCGTGTWIIDAAKQWPNCNFVGFDLVNVQIPSSLLDSSVADRISWVHGNFLTTRLPFEDDQFDHVHVQFIATGVPENKWGVLFDEINRVLRPGGSVEIIEDDIVFPSLPRWFTASLRTRPRRTTSIHLPDGTMRGGYPSPPHTPSKDMPSHDHALLESLFSSVFEHRFINMKPSAVLPSYITTYFRHVTVCPVLHFSMPPLPPPQPLPEQQISSYPMEPSDSSTMLLSPSSVASGNRPPSLSFSSTLSMTSTTADSLISPVLLNSPPREKSVLATDSHEFMLGSLPDVEPKEQTENVKSFDFKMFSIDSSLDMGEGTVPHELFPVERLESLKERSLAMHLYRSYQTVLACEEALWEEMKDRLRNRREELTPFGWDDDEELEELQSRKRFERLIERYRSDMQTRVSLWCSLNDIGWPFPPRDPLSKAELIEEERIRDAMLDARRYAPAEETPCRSLRVLVGYKA